VGLVPLVPLLLLVPDSAPTASGRRESVVQPALLQLASDGKHVAFQAAFSFRLWVLPSPSPYSSPSPLPLQRHTLSVGGIPWTKFDLCRTGFL